MNATNEWDQSGLLQRLLPISEQEVSHIVTDVINLQTGLTSFSLVSRRSSPDGERAIDFRNPPELPLSSKNPSQREGRFSSY
jgi:hypothetical protein